MFTGLLAGYLLGTVLGFMLWHPDRDMWALLGFVLAIVGLFAGLTPFFRHHLGVALLAIAGFYVGVLLGIVLFATPSETTMIDALRGNPGGLASAVTGTVIGGALGARLPLDKARLLLFAFLIGGFLGGYLFGAVLGLAPWQSVVGWAPAVILSGLAAGGAAILIQRSAHRAAAPDG